MTTNQNETSHQQEPHGWRMVSTPDAQDICERIIGVTFPVEQQILIISYEGIHVVDLDGSWHVHDDDQYPEGGDIYDWKNQTATYDGKQFQVLGVHGDRPFLRNAYDERLVFIHNKQRLPGQMSFRQQFQVQGKQGEVLLEYEFEDLSGDWMQVSFSPDSTTIVLATPYHFSIFQRTEEK
jgi:hypothetical protein